MKHHALISVFSNQNELKEIVQEMHDCGVGDRYFNREEQGIGSVPSPKPEKRVKPEVSRAAKPMIKYSTRIPTLKHSCNFQGVYIPLQMGPFVAVAG